MNAEKLLCSLIETESISGNELDIANFLKDYLHEMGFIAKIDGRNLICEFGKGSKTLLLNSHLDTVPVCPGWTLDPFKAKKIKGRIYGLGSNDAKGCVASMTNAFVSLKEETINGKIILTLTCDEETGGQGLEYLIKKIRKPDAAIVGEPTKLDICIAQKGDMILKINSKGKSAHSSYPEMGINAIYKACNYITSLNGIKFNKKHNVLGFPTIAVTVIKGGLKTNVVPAECEFIVDVRSTPKYNHEELFRMVKSKLKDADVHKHSIRLVPKETKKDELIVRIAKKVLKSRLIGSSTMSDWVFLDCPTIKLGPGNSTMSHQANEHIHTSQLNKAVESYKRIINGFLS
ncbi:M20/M25/M40 family metallo-hydrolase [Candidatus Woesearchaeota archaeon]|nr:M20/M25/M40 family metallo-hydrolase [Candidatus Woesearchaeota archaeon]